MKILICDDHPLVIKDLTEYFETNLLFELAGTAVDGKEAVEKYKIISPDITIMDISMEEMNGIEAAKKIIEYDNNAKILFYSMNVNQSVIFNCYKIGGRGFLSKEEPQDNIQIALQTISKGEKYFGFFFTKENYLNYKNYGNTSVRTKRKLSFREEDILKYAAKKYNDLEISEVLGIGIKAIRGHKINIKQKLGLSDLENFEEIAIKYVEKIKSNCK